MNIRIEYCEMWNYKPRALSLRADLSDEYGYWSKLVTGARGSFEVYVDEYLLFSKLELDRFPNESEIINLINLYSENGEI